MLAAQVAAAAPTKPAAAAPSPATSAAAPAAKARKLSYKEKRELEELPARIAALETEQKTISAQLADNTLYAKTPAQVPVLQTRFAQLDEELLAAMERWEVLSAPA
jgi:ATP-binding cassette subfamily F protein uup